MKVFSVLLIALSSVPTCHGNTRHYMAAAVKKSKNPEVVVNNPRQRSELLAQQAWKQAEKAGYSFEEEAKRLAQTSASAVQTPKKPDAKKKAAQKKAAAAAAAKQKAAAQKQKAAAEKQKAAAAVDKQKVVAQKQRAVDRATAIALSNKQRAADVAADKQRIVAATKQRKVSAVAFKQRKATSKPKPIQNISKPLPNISKPKMVDLSRSIANYQSLISPRKNRKQSLTGIFKGVMESVSTEFDDRHVDYDAVGRNFVHSVFNTVVFLCLFTSVSTITAALIDHWENRIFGEAAFTFEKLLTTQRIVTGTMELVSVLMMLHPFSRQFGSFFVTLMYTASLMNEEVSLLEVIASGTIAFLSFLVFVNDMLYGDNLNGKKRPEKRGLF